jgi:hypothetical protein
VSQDLRNEAARFAGGRWSGQAWRYLCRVPGEPFRYVIYQAARQIRAAPSRFRNPYRPRSDYAAAYVITAWCLYHWGNAPCGLRRDSRSSWRLQCLGVGEIAVEVANPNDHRDGVVMAAQQELLPHGP